jgi:hypothetical protein
MNLALGILLSSVSFFSSNKINKFSNVIIALIIGFIGFVTIESDLLGQLGHIEKRQGLFFSLLLFILLLNDVDKNSYSKLQQILVPISMFVISGLQLTLTTFMIVLISFRKQRSSLWRYVPILFLILFFGIEDIQQFVVIGHELNFVLVAALTTLILLSTDELKEPIFTLLLFYSTTSGFDISSSLFLSQSLGVTLAIGGAILTIAILDIRKYYSILILLISTLFVRDIFYPIIIFLILLTQEKYISISHTRKKQTKLILFRNCNLVIAALVSFLFVIVLMSKVSVWLQLLSLLLSLYAISRIFIIIRENKVFNQIGYDIVYLATTVVFSYLSWVF